MAEQEAVKARRRRSVTEEPSTLDSLLAKVDLSHAAEVGRRAGSRDQVAALAGAGHADPHGDQAGRGAAGRQGAGRQRHRRARPPDQRSGQRHPPPAGLPEAGGGLARPQVPGRPHRVPAQHQAGDPQRLEGGSRGRLRGRAGADPVGAVQARLRAGVRPAGRPADRRHHRQLRVREPAPGPRPAAQPVEDRRRLPRAVHRRRRRAVLRQEDRGDPAPARHGADLRHRPSTPPGARSANRRTRATSASPSRASCSASPTGRTRCR